MRENLAAWCRSWRRRDLLYILIGSLVMVVGMVMLASHGWLVLLPLFAGVAALWPTPLSKFPFGPPV